MLLSHSTLWVFELINSAFHITQHVWFMFPQNICTAVIACKVSSAATRCNDVMHIGQLGSTAQAIGSIDDWHNTPGMQFIRRSLTCMVKPTACFNMCTISQLESPCRHWQRQPALPGQGTAWLARLCASRSTTLRSSAASPKPSTTMW